MADDSGTKPITEDLILSALELIQLANRQGRRELTDRLIEALHAEVVSARPLETGQEPPRTPELPEAPRAIEPPTPRPGPPAPAEAKTDPVPGAAAKPDPDPDTPTPKLPSPAPPKLNLPDPPPSPAAGSPAPRSGRGRIRTPINPHHTAMVDSFEAYLQARDNPPLDDKTVDGFASFIRKLAFVVEQEGKTLTEVDRAIFERAARGRFASADYSDFIPDRASASSANTAKSAIAHFADFLRLSGYADWANPSRGASLPKQAGISAPKAIPWKDVETFLADSAERAGVVLERHLNGDERALGKCRTTPMWPLRVVAGFVGLATAHLTGVRLTELVSLQVTDVDLGAEAHIKVFRAKNDKPREIPIGRRLVEILDPYLGQVRHQIEPATESELLLVDVGAQSRRGSFPDGGCVWSRSGSGRSGPRARPMRAYGGTPTSPDAPTPPGSWHKASTWASSSTSLGTPALKQRPFTRGPPET